MKRYDVDRLPVNVLAEPVFENELQAYEHFAVKFDIESIQDDALLYERRKSIPVMKKQRNSKHNKIELSYIERVHEICAEEYKKEHGAELTKEDTSYGELTKPYNEKAEEVMQGRYEIWCTFKNKLQDAFSRIPLIVGVDTGKHNTKYAYMDFDIEKGTYTEVTTGVFESRVSEVNSLSKTGLSKLTKFDGKSYLISKEADRVCSDLANDVAGKTKAHEYHRVLLGAALREVCEKTGRNLFNVVVGISVDSLTADNGAGVYLTMLDRHPHGTEEYDNLSNKEKKEYVIKMMDELINDYTGTTFNLEYGAQKYEIVINDLLVAPETQSGSFSLGDIDDFESEEYYNLYIIDIGGLNRTILPIIGGVPQIKKMDTNYNGMTNIVEEATKDLIREAADYNDDILIDKSFVERSIKFYELKDEDQLVDDYLFKYFDELTSSLKRLDGCSFSPQTGKLIFIGGGSHSLKGFIETYYTNECKTTFPVEVIDDALYSNVVGMYYFGEQRFEDRKKYNAA